MPTRSTIKISPEEYAEIKQVASKNERTVAKYVVHSSKKLPILEEFLMSLLQDNSAETQSKLRNKGLKLLKM